MSSHSEGGLGIKSLKCNNKALLGKWLWRFGIERDNLWRKVIVAKYGLMSDWMSKDPQEGYGFGLWKFILFCKLEF